MIRQIEDIAIIGGGIGGLASAILFARRGCTVTVYEQADGPGPVGAGFLLQPPGQAVLKHLGVLDDILLDAVPIFGLESKTTSGYKILDLDYRRLGGIARHGLGVQRRTIYQALYERANALDNVRFRWGGAVSHCASHADGVVVDTEGERGTHDFCVLASGSNSGLGASLFSNRVHHQYAWGCVWSTIDLPYGFSPDLLHQRCHRADRMMGILPVLKYEGGYKAALYWSVKIANVEDAGDAEYAAIKQQIIDFWPEAASSIEPLAKDDFIAAMYRDVWTPRPFRERLIMIGDACHATSPQLGQGCTMALLDAYCLAQCFDSNDSIEIALNRWWRLRKRQLRYVRQLSRFLTPLYQSDHALFGAFRNTIVAPFGKLPGFYRLQLKTLASEVFLEAPDRTR
ncbi:MAG: NAD(P)/FAD-dependent oxidoreductase [Pseudomonadota bacterium]